MPILPSLPQRFGPAAMLAMPQVRAGLGKNPDALVDHDQFSFLIALINSCHWINLLGDRLVSV